MSSALEKILNLAKKTGDNVIVFNPAKPKDSYVILALNSYESLVNNCYDDCCLTEDDLDDKINSEIAPWEEDWDDTSEDSEDEEEDFDPRDFLPQDIFGTADQDFDGETEKGDDAEKVWEEEVNYLYPTEEQIASEATAEALKNNSDFNSIADILEDKRDRKSAWNEPAESFDSADMQNLENLEDNNLNNQ